MRRESPGQERLLYYDRAMANEALGTMTVAKLPHATRQELVDMWWNMHVEEFVREPMGKPS